MPLNIAILMDPPASLNYSKDSTYVMALEAQNRGHNITYLNPDTLSLRNKDVRASGAAIKFSSDIAAPYKMDESQSISLKSFDIILLRQDFNNPQSYNAMTHMLDHLRQDVCMLNDPSGVRESPEKMLITHFPELAPPTIITRNLEDIRHFSKEYPELIIKPLNGFGGLDIYHLKENDDNLTAVFDMMTRMHSEPLVVQKYLPEIRQGDKRVIVVEGEPVGALLRVPAQNNARANLATGGSAQIGEIRDREREICAALKETLIARGLSFVGLDVIGDYVTEINPKSPTGLQHIKKLQNIDCCPLIWDAFEDRYERFRRQKTA